MKPAAKTSVLWCNGEWRHMISVKIKITTKRLIIHEAETNHKYLTNISYHQTYPLEIHSTRKNWNRRLTKTLGKLEENLRETRGYFTVASCTSITRLRTHAPDKIRGKPLVRIPCRRHKCNNCWKWQEDRGQKIITDSTGFKTVYPEILYKWTWMTYLFWSDEFFEKHVS